MVEYKLGEFKNPVGNNYFLVITRLLDLFLTVKILVMVSKLRCILPMRILGKRLGSLLTQRHFNFLVTEEEVYFVLIKAGFCILKDLVRYYRLTCMMKCV